MTTSRVSVRSALIDARFPASRRDLLDHVRSNGAQPEILDVLEDLPAGMYTDLDEVVNVVSSLDG